MSKSIYPKSYSEALAMLQGSYRKSLGGNTSLKMWPEAKTITVQLYDTCIVSFFKDGSIQLDSGSYLTVTTKRRMNQCLPSCYKVASFNGQWVVYIAKETAISFYDGMVLGGQIQHGAI